MSYNKLIFTTETFGKEKSVSAGSLSCPPIWLFLVPIIWWDREIKTQNFRTRIRSIHKMEQKSFTAKPLPFMSSAPQKLANNASTICFFFYLKEKIVTHTLSADLAITAGWISSGNSSADFEDLFLSASCCWIQIIYMNEIRKRVEMPCDRPEAQWRGSFTGRAKLLGIASQWLLEFLFSSFSFSLSFRRLIEEIVAQIEQLSQEDDGLATESAYARFMWICSRPLKKLDTSISWYLNWGWAASTYFCNSSGPL